MVGRVAAPSATASTPSSHSSIEACWNGCRSACAAAAGRPEDAAAAVRADGHISRWWLDAVSGRGYPADMVDTYRVALPLRDGDLACIATPTDYLGVNYYFRQVGVDDPDGPAPFFQQVPVPGWRNANQPARTTAIGASGVAPGASSSPPPWRLAAGDGGSPRGR